MFERTYLIGEIGQNHNGSVEIAKLIVDVAARPIIDHSFSNVLNGMDAIKLTKRDLSCELTASSYNKIYDSPHAFGKTYGDHRQALELTYEEHFEIYRYSKEKGLDVIETLCSPSCLKIISYFTPDKLKIASRDLTNLPLLEALAETRIPIILSTGMGGKTELDKALEIITRYHNNIAILHCVSEYPTNPKHANLNSILYLHENYPQFITGYSDHTIGISTPVAAVAMGAKILEKHITIDRKMKGTDQAGSLGIDGIQRMIRDIRLLELSFGRKDLFIEPAVSKGKIKLGRSIATNRVLKKGEVIEEKDLHLLSPGDGIQWGQKHNIIGKKLRKGISANEIIYPEFVEN